MGETSRHAGSEQSRALGRPDVETITPLQGHWVPDVASVCCVVCHQDTDVEGAGRGMVLWKGVLSGWEVGMPTGEHPVG